MPVSLHTHSWYSLLEGVSSPESLLARAARLGYTALALTDTNNLYGAVAFVEQAFRHDVRPLLGARLRLGQRRCVALIADRAGYRSLCRILSRLHLEGEPAERSAAPDLLDLLRDNAEGLHILADDVGLAEALREPFGRRLWLEIVRPHPGLSSRPEQELLACGKRLGIRAVASTAAHFATPEDYPTFRVVTAVRQRALLDRLPAALPLTLEHHLVSPEEFRRRFRDLPALAHNTDCLAELLRSDVLPRDLVLPAPILPRGCGDVAGYLHRLCERGLRRRDLGADLEARRRLREELTIIEAAQLPGYFLTVRGIARYARRRGHGMALRGSAGNSLVCYLLGITNVDPLRFRLPLERFLHPGRTDLPDIDLDFDWKVRDEVIAHVVKRYGQAHTAQISSHLSFQPRSAFREAGRVHGLSDGQISDLLTTLSEPVNELLLSADGDEGTRGHEDAWPGGSGPSGPLSSCDLVTLPPCPRSFPLEPGRWPRLLVDARRLLGRPQHLSIHPGGVVITPGPIADHVPLQRAAKGVVITQFDKDAIERIGLVKIDLLGNRALSTVDEARRIVVSCQLSVDSRCLTDNWQLTTDNYSDPATLDLLRRGDMLGVTQLESPAMRSLLVQMRPRGLEDVILALALLRPAAGSLGMKECFIRRRHGLEPQRLLHPRLAALLDETHGVMVFEDDALRLIQGVTGLSPADADRFRKRVAKHTGDAEAQVLRAEFLALAHCQGVPAEAVEELWPQLAKFNRYSFCKSHAVSYGLIAWEAAYLKAHQPLPFWTAALNNAQGAYPRRVYIEAIKRAGLEVRLPCVNRSGLAFTLEGSAIRTGLSAIAGLPREVQDQLLAERARHGPYLDLSDFRRRLHPGPEALALLIRCGALDWTGRPRPALFLDAELEDLTRPQGPELFANQPLLDWTPDDYSAARRLRDEWELLGFVLGPPLFALFCPPAEDDKVTRRQGDKVTKETGESVTLSPCHPVTLSSFPLVSSQELPAHRGRVVRVRGLVATARHAFTEDGRPLQFITLEDDKGLSEVTLFPGTCPQVPYLTIGPYLATGVVEEQHGVFTLTARAFEPLTGERLAAG